MEPKCKNCWYWEPHLYGVAETPTGYGACSRHFAVQLKTPNDAVLILTSPITWYKDVCSLFSETEVIEE